MKNLVFLFLFTCLLNSCQKSTFIPNYTPTANLDQQLGEIYQKGQLPGFAVAIIKSDKILFEKSIGYANLKNKTRYTNTTQQNIASLSKTFIGIALMKTIEQGKLSLDTPINEILPFAVHNPHHPTIPITIRHLATHTASIDDYSIGYKSVFLKESHTLDKKVIGKENYTFIKEWSKNKSIALGKFLQSALTVGGINYDKNRFSKSKPGGQYKYSNLGASLLGYIIEITVNQSFADYVSTEILQPLSLNQTQWNFEEKNNLVQASTYFQDQQVVPTYQSILYPSGGMHSTLHDLSLYLMEVLKTYEGTNSLLPTTVFREMVSPQLIPAQSPLSDTKNQGFMWELNGQQAGHNGGNYGVTLFMSFDKEKGYGRIFMTNISSYKDQKLIPQMVEIWKLLGKEGELLSK